MKDKDMNMEQQWGRKRGGDRVKGRCEGMRVIRMHLYRQIKSSKINLTNKRKMKYYKDMLKF